MIAITVFFVFAHMFPRLERCQRSLHCKSSVLHFVSQVGAVTIRAFSRLSPKPDYTISHRFASPTQHF
jgi:hypothetical protein